MGRGFFEPHMTSYGDIIWGHKGDFRISRSGVPLEIPPGLLGHEPKMAISVRLEKAFIPKISVIVYNSEKKFKKNGNFFISQEYYHTQYNMKT